jgi:hypothetical protein
MEKEMIIVDSLITASGITLIAMLPTCIYVALTEKKVGEREVYGYGFVPELIIMGIKRLVKK